MADFTYHDYLLHKVVQPFSIRGQNSESTNLKKNIPLYMTRQAGKVREKYDKMDSKGIVTKQAVQPPQVFLDTQFEKLQAQQEGMYIRKPGIDTNIGMSRTVKTIFQDDDDLNGKDDPIINNIKNRMWNDKYIDDFFVLTEGARPRNIQKEEKLSVEKQIKTVLQEKVNEDQLKKLYRKYVLETMKKNITLEKKLQIFEKDHDVKIGSLQAFEKRKNSLSHVNDLNYGKSASMVAINVAHSLVLHQNSLDKDKSKQIQTLTNGTRVFGLDTIPQIPKDQLDLEKPIFNQNKAQAQKQLLTLKTRLSGIGGDFIRRQSQIKDQPRSPANKDIYMSPISAFRTPLNKEDELNKQNIEEEEDTQEFYQLKQLQKLQDINKKQQQYKFNNKESEKLHIRNICNHFDLSIQKLFNLEDKRQLENNQMVKLTEISLESDRKSEEEEGNFDQIEDDDDSMVMGKNKQQSDKTSLFKGGETKSTYNDKSKEQKPPPNKSEMMSCIQREEEVLFERIKCQNEENIINEQDEKLIKSIINLENKQQLYQKYVQKKKRELQLQNLLNMKEMSMKKQFLNSVFSSNSPHKQDEEDQEQKSKQRKATQQSEKKQIQSIQSFSNMKDQNDFSGVLKDFVKNDQQANLTKQRSYKLQNGIPVHENSVLSFLKSDYKLNETPKNIYSDKPYNRSTKFNKSLQVPKFIPDSIGSGNNLNVKKISLARLTQLSTPKYANEGYMNEIGRKNSYDNMSTQMTSGRQTFKSKSQSISNKSNKNNNLKSPQVDFYTTRKENKAEVDKMKLYFLNFFDNCFEKKHEFEEEKTKLRQEISEWYCQNQQELTKLSNYQGPKLSTLSQEFKSFIEQKNFKKKLFNYLINSMEQKDRQMAIYLYKQDRQLDDL